MRRKMLLFAADDLEAERLIREFMKAGIPCEVGNAETANSGCDTRTALWVMNPHHLDQALALYERRGSRLNHSPDKAVAQESLSLQPQTVPVQTLSPEMIPRASTPALGITDESPRPLRRVPAWRGVAAALRAFCSQICELFARV